jgi:hypothetical protein
LGSGAIAKRERFCDTAIMCTVVILRRPDHDWPFILAANRDEQLSRPWKAPARHWPDRPDVVAGLDELGRGSWMGLNDLGVVACILNRRGTLGPQDGKRSRGEIVLDALDYEDAAAAIESLSHLDGNAFRDFNLIVADNRDAYWLRLDETRSKDIEVNEIPAGFSMLTAADLNDPTSLRIQTFLPQFEAAPAPDPASDDWSIWPNLMGSRSDGGSAGGSPSTAMCFCTETGFGTSSSALVALPSIDSTFHSPPARKQWLFAEGPPDSASFKPVAL